MTGPLQGSESPKREEPAGSRRSSPGLGVTQELGQAHAKNKVLPKNQVSAKGLGSAKSRKMAKSLKRLGADG